MSPPLIPSSHKYYTNSSLMQSFVLTASSFLSWWMCLSCTWLSSFWILPIHLFYFSQFLDFSVITTVLQHNAPDNWPFLPHFTHFQRSVLQLSLHLYCLTSKWQMNFFQPCKMWILQEAINYKPVCISNLLFVASPSHILHFRFGEQSVYFESGLQSWASSFFNVQ